VYATQIVADSTAFWQIIENESPRPLFAIHGNIYDVTCLNGAIYLSSDYERGIENPTVYRYLRNRVLPAR
jgi:hypothetical protein